MKRPVVRDHMTSLPQATSPDASVAEAAQIMAEGDIRHLPVLERNRLVGVVSLRDIQFLEGLEDVATEGLSIEDVMTEDPYTVPPDEPLDVVAEYMARHKLGSALVIDHEETIGVFTTTDALEALSQLLRG